MEPAVDLNGWLTTSEYRSFKRNLIEKPGQHLLGLGMTGAGKTMKAVVLCKWCLEAGKAVAWFDTRKPDDVNYLLSLVDKVKVFHPKDTTLTITGTDSKEVKICTIENPDTLFREIEPGLNIISIRPFFTDLPPYVKYLSRVMHGLLNDSFNKQIKTHPLQIFMDEFQEICPAKRIHSHRSQQELGARIAMSLFQLRGFGIGFCAFTQSYKNIMNAIRLQFHYYLVCKDPDGDRMDYIGTKLLRTDGLCSKFAPDTSIIIHPNGRYGLRIHWPLPIKDDKIMIDYEGLIFPENKDEGKAIWAPKGMEGEIKAFIKERKKEVAVTLR